MAGGEGGFYGIYGVLEGGLVLACWGVLVQQVGAVGEDFFYLRLYFCFV